MPNADAGRHGRRGFGGVPAALPVPTVYTGQFTRWDVNTVTAQRTTNLGAQVRGGRFGRSVGLQVDPATPNTTMLYSCRTATDVYMSTDPDVSLGVIALTQQPGTVALTACRSGTDTFLSLQADCEGEDRMALAVPTGGPGVPATTAMPNHDHRRVVRDRRPDP